MTTAPLSQQGVTYDRGLSARPGRWRGFVAILALAVSFPALSFAFSFIGVGIDIASGAYTYEDLEAGTDFLTPVSMLTNNLAIAALLPVAMLLQWALFGVRPRWLSSIEGRFRWRWFGRLALLVVPIWIVYIGLALVFGPIEPITFTGLQPVSFAPPVLGMLLVVLISAPLQSAGEEYGARGLIQRSVGSWFSSPVTGFIVGTIISGALFAGAHAASDPWLIAYYFVFGASLCVAARGTGGLEAPVLIHAANNVLLLIPIVLTSQTARVFDRDSGAAGPFMIMPMLLLIGAALLSIGWGRRQGILRVAALPPTGPGRPSAPEEKTTYPDDQHVR